MENTNLKKYYCLNARGGITLIALVVTIIVLLILAGIAISTLVGENGLIKRASEAKVTTEQAGKDEKRRLTQLEAATNLTKTTKTIDGQEVPIPEKFAISQVDGENTIENGLVIIGEDGDEYVWIPCSLNEYQNAYDDNWADFQFHYTEFTWEDPQSDEHGIAQTSISTHNGFYVSRYEAGIPSNLTEIYADSDGDVYLHDEKDISIGIPVSRQGVQAWSFVSQPNAIILASKMVSNNSAQSYLIDSKAWSMVCKKIAEKVPSITDSTDYGNYYNNIKTQYDKLNTLYAVHSFMGDSWYATDIYRKGFVLEAPKGEGNSMVELATGSSDDFKKYNIYDIAGNMWEWTTKISINPIGRALRFGGSFHGQGNTDPPVCSHYAGAGSRTVDIGFRSVIYLK